MLSKSLLVRFIIIAIIIFFTQQILGMGKVVQRMGWMENMANLWCQDQERITSCFI